MPKLLLIRHGQASFGAADYDQLSELGERQAQLVAAELGRRGERVTRLVAGSLKRQQGTAAPIAAALGGLPIETDARWNEYDTADVLTAHSPTDLTLEHTGGLSSRDFQAVLEDGLAAWHTAADGSTATEPWPAFHDRVTSALADALATLGSGETAVVCSSGGAIAAAASAILGADLSTFLGLNRTAVNAAITTISAGRSGTALLGFNDHAHLLGAESRGLITFR